MMNESQLQIAEGLVTFDIEARRLQAGLRFRDLSVAQHAVMLTFATRQDEQVTAHEICESLGFDMPEEATHAMAVRRVSTHVATSQSILNHMVFGLGDLKTGILRSLRPEGKNGWIMYSRWEKP